MSADSIKNAIREMAKTGDEVYSIVCTVTSVSVSEKTCKCSPIDGRADLLGVRLMAQNQVGFFITPKVNSIVVVTMINGFTGYVAMFSEVSEIQLNGKNYDGLIKIAKLTDALNDLVNAINLQLPLIAAGISAGGGSYSPTLMQVFNKIDFENLTVKHGNG